MKERANVINIRVDQCELIKVHGILPILKSGPV